MVSSYRLQLAEENIDIKADRFEIVEGGALVFYEDVAPESVSLVDMREEKPFAAYSEWDAVEET